MAWEPSVEVEVEVEVEGAALPVTVSGDGPTVVWGHGLTSDTVAEGAELGPVFDILQPYVRLVRYDARGHGRAAGVPTFRACTWPALADDMLEIARFVNASSAPFVAAGVSMGSATALWAALRDPGRVRALILVTPPTAWHLRAPQASRYGALAAALAEGGMARFAAAVRALTVVGEAAPDDAEALVARLGETDPRSLVSVYRGAAASDLPDRERIRTVAVPSLVLACRGDPNHPLEVAEILAETLPNSRLAVADGPGTYDPWMNALEGFAAAL